MRHRKKFNHLGRKAGHRKSMFANMASSLIQHKRINTTTAKAKALRQFIEPIITKSKTDTTHNRRLAFAKLRQKEAVTELFREVAPKVGDRPGGYTRVIKLGNRLGDNADMAMIELVDYNELYKPGKEEEKKKTRRSRRGGKSKTKAPAATAETEKPEAIPKTGKAEAKSKPEKEEQDSSPKNIGDENNKAGEETKAETKPAGEKEESKAEKESKAKPEGKAADLKETKEEKPKPEAKDKPEKGGDAKKKDA